MSFGTASLQVSCCHLHEFVCSRYLSAQTSYWLPWLPHQYPPRAHCHRCYLVINWRYRAQVTIVVDRLFYKAAPLRRLAVPFFSISESILILSRHGTLRLARTHYSEPDVPATGKHDVFFFFFLLVRADDTLFCIRCTG
jgi:hypothetical protein